MHLKKDFIGLRIPDFIEMHMNTVLRGFLYSTVAIT